MPETLLFKGLPLEASKRMFRLWRLRPSLTAEEPRLWRLQSRLTAEELKLDLKVFAVEDCPEYIALSYMWGPQADKVTIEVNDSALQITRQLWEFLSTIKSAHPYAQRYTNTSDDWANGFFGRETSQVPQRLPQLDQQWFWADQISMNQNNISERNHQVRLMGDIFSRASSVWAWLGTTSWMPNFGIEIMEACRRFVPSQTIVSELLYSLDIFTRPYWSRLWVVQEICLGKSHLFWCGSDVVSRRVLHKRFSYHFDSKFFDFWKVVLQLRQEVPASRATQQIWKLLYLDDRGGVEPADQLRAISTLLGPSIHDSDAQMLDLDQAIQKFSGNICTDPRDNVYGLQMLVEPDQRIPIDYDKTLRNVVFDCAVLIMRHKRNECLLNDVHLGWSFVTCGDIFSSNVYSLMRGLGKIFATAGLSEDLLATLLWSYMMANFINDLLLAAPSGRVSWDERLNFTDFRRRTVWHRAAMNAVSTKQKAFGLELLECAISGRLRALIDRYGREVVDTASLESTAGVGRNRSQYEECITDLLSTTKEVIERTAGRHGFVIYGDFLSHPDDWPFPKEKPSYTFDMRMEQWRRLEGKK